MLNGDIKQGNFYHDVVYEMINETQYLKKYDVNVLFDGNDSYGIMSQNMYKSINGNDFEEELGSIYRNFVYAYLMIVKRRHWFKLFIVRLMNWNIENIDMLLLDRLCIKYIKEED
jgi:hypothetical protein